MMVISESPQRGIVFRSLRTVFRLIAPDSLIELQRGFRENLTTGGLRYAIRWIAELCFGEYRCSVCVRRVSSFEPIPSEHLDNLRTYGWKYTGPEAETCNLDGYTCPHCGASDRDRLYALYLKKYFASLRAGRPLKMVDFAPTVPLSGFIRKLVAQLPYRVSYVTADLLMEDVDDKVDLLNMHIYEDCSVDFFICSHILEHVDDDRKALSELYRILRPGGQGILVVPIILTIDEIDEDPTLADHGERWRRFGQFDHVRLYSKGGFISRVRDAGFLIRQLGAEHFGETTFRKHGITAQSILYIVERK